MFSFSIKDTLWITLVVAICVQWVLTNRLSESDLRKQREEHRLLFANCSTLYDAVKSLGLKITEDEDGYYVVERAADRPARPEAVSN
jgi:hypothetical protein